MTNTGTIKQIIGPVVDVEFTGELPNISKAGRKLDKIMLHDIIMA